MFPKSIAIQSFDFSPSIFVKTMVLKLLFFAHFSPLVQEVNKPSTMDKVAEVQNVIENLVHSREKKEDKIQDLTTYTEIKNDHMKVKKPQKLRKQKKRLSRNEIKNMGLYSLPKKTLKYSDYTDLNSMWNSYMDQQFGDNNTKQLELKFNPAHPHYDNTSALIHKSDLHGAKLKVKMSKCASLIGHKGIILMDTKGTFSIICKDNVLRTIPKSDSIFELKWRSLKFVVYGKHLCYRSADRSTKKRKVMSEIELETEFEKINLDENSNNHREESKCDCKKILLKPLEHSNTGSSLKVKDKRKNLIKPARLKMIGTCLARKSRNIGSEEPEDTKVVVPELTDDLETFTSEAFLKMRITPSDVLSHQASSPSEDKDEKSSSASQPNSCSAQAKLQQQFSSSEFDSTIDEMSEWMSYHLNLYPRDKFLVDSMYT
ncbi:CLUMA_CG009358, isoform A [Clunio marinus]|uniref:Ribonuclease P protein subunit p29 n=1 Tax=Clunio marinus TaxID=568069 RepID=A0A1J1I6M4_9DIPT|nr:CLUMA_CG009358, isoform A [Clunio marinus]